LSERTIPENRRILIVDDNQAIHEDFRKILANAPSGDSELEAAESALFGDEAPTNVTYADYDLTFASQGQEALEKAKAAVAEGNPFALAFVDVRMPPGWDGIETTTHLWETAPDLQVVICTAYSDYSWDEMIGKFGQSDRLVILKKPFDNVEVLQLACAMTEKWRLQQEARIRLDQLEDIINARTGELRSSIRILQQNVDNYQRSEQRLRRSEERFKLIAENAADLIIVMSVDGKPEYFSPSVMATLGRNLDGSQDTSVFDWLHPEDTEGTTASISASINQNTCQILELRLKHKNGTWRDLEARVCAIREKVDNEPHLVIVARDLSKHKEMESQTAFLTKKLLEAREGTPSTESKDLATRLQSPLQSLSHRIRYVKDTVNRITPILEEQQKLVDSVTEDGAPQKGTESEAGDSPHQIATDLPKAITESLENVEQICQMIEDLGKEE
jgi:PAS domain S-box-containing protein